MNKLISAINFAAISHQNQRRKNEAKTPYINHPIEVMYLLSEAGVTDYDILCAAVLHDTIEDTGVTYEQICGKFGESVANIVAECSDDKSLPKEIRKQQQIEHSCTKSSAAKLVKAADKLSNLNDLDTTPPSGWCKWEIDGYFCWSYAVWLQIRGLNDKLDSQLSNLFEKRNLLNIDNVELSKRLDSYYEKIRQA